MTTISRGRTQRPHIILRKSFESCLAHPANSLFIFTKKLIKRPHFSVDFFYKTGSDKLVSESDGEEILSVLHKFPPLAIREVTNAFFCNFLRDAFVNLAYLTD